MSDLLEQDGRRPDHEAVVPSPRWDQLMGRDRAMSEMVKAELRRPSLGPGQMLAAASGSSRRWRRSCEVSRHNRGRGSRPTPGLDGGGAAYAALHRQRKEH